MTSSPHIFISFKTEEIEFATKLRGALVESGFIVWWQEEIQCGHEWHGTIDREIKMASAIIVLWSKKAMQSVWVMHEASQAISRDVKFDKGKLQLFEATYRTDKIRFDVSSPDLISVVDLIDADLNMKGILFSSIRFMQMKDILISTNGESSGGIKIAEVKNFDREKHRDFDETFKLRQEYFDSKILSEN